MKTISIDADLENADWTKQAWDLPPYKSKEFFEQVDDLDHFRTTPVYLHAEANGLIHDDEWVADFTSSPLSKPDKHIHIYLP